MRIELGNREGNVIRGHVSDCALSPLLDALRRYDEQLYLKWNAGNSKKRAGRGFWELRRKPELKSVKETYELDTPKGFVGRQGDIYDLSAYGLGTVLWPKYHETSGDCVKEFDTLGYHIVSWVAKQDLWKYGFKGKNFVKESEYQEAKFEEKIDEDSYNEKMYGLKQMKTQINDFRQYILDGGDPYRLLDFWK